MKRIAASILFALGLGAGPAAAGDGAALNVLGFSADGRYFAFEQYGVRDGSGSLFSTITALEVAGDLLVKGTPVTAVMDPDDPNFGKEPRDKQLADVRARAAVDAAALFKQLGIAQAGSEIAAVPGSRARSILDAEQVKTVGKATVAMLTMDADRFGPDARLQLREFDIALPRCKNLVTGEHPNGFGLTLERKGRSTIHLHRDQTIPAVRGCPEHYGLVAVHAHTLSDGITALAVVIQYFYLGFEGPDRRFLVVTGRVR